MAKKPKEVPSASLLDFQAENLLDNSEEEVDPIEDEEEEEEEEEEPQPPVKKKVVKKEPPKEEPEPDPSEEEEEEDPANSEEQHEEEEEQADFWGEVSKITGTEVEVEFGEVDPVSPQGAAIREKAVAEKAIDNFISKLQEEYPAVYQALEYVSNGGDIRELYKGDKDYTKVQIADDDEDHARVILTEYYQAKGFNDARIKRILAADSEAEEGLVGTAKAALAEMAEAQEQEKAEAVQQQQAQAQRQREQDQKFLSAVNNILAKGQLDTFKVPKQETTAFFQYLKGSLQRDGEGGYMIVTPVDPAQLELQLKAEYFKFKKGDLNQLIQMKATTENTKKLKLRLQAKEDSPKQTSTPKVTGTLKDLEI